VEKGLSLFVACIGIASPVAAASDNAGLPRRADVSGALNQAAEDRFLTYLDQFSPASVAGHVIPVNKVSDLACVIRPGQAVDCHFAAHYENKIVYHTATLSRDGDRWRIIDDHIVDAPPR